MGPREVKQAVAMELISAAGTLVEFWTSRFEARGEQPPCNGEEAREMIARWLKDLPGESWDVRLEPPYNS